MLQHIRYHHFWGDFSCLQCGSKAKYVDDLLEHMEQNNHADDHRHAADDYDDERGNDEECWKENSIL